MHRITYTHSTRTPDPGRHITALVIPDPLLLPKPPAVDSQSRIKTTTHSEYNQKSFSCVCARASSDSWRGFLRIAIVLLGVLVATGCVRTQLPLRPAPPELERLIEVNTYPLALSLSADTSPAIGNQFVFVGVPLGEISGDQVAQIVFQEFRTQLALAGFAPKTEGTIPPEVPALHVTLQAASLEAYDLFLTRRVRCSLTLHTELHLPPTEKHDLRPNRSSDITHETSEYMQYAFEEQLGKEFRRCSQESVERVLKDLRMNDVRLMPRVRNSASVR